MTLWFWKMVRRGADAVQYAAWGVYLYAHGRIVDEIEARASGR